MGRYRVTKRAETDMLEIWAYIAEVDMRSADQLAERFSKRMEQLAAFPESGMLRDDVRPGLRCSSLEPYSIFYRIVEDEVEIVRIIHGARNIPPGI